MDTYWDLLGQIRDVSDTDYKYPLLSRLVKAVLIIPHGNSDTERLFSHIGLNKTKHRSCLSIDTLNSLLTIQFYTPYKCYEFRPSQDMIQRCKNAIGEVDRIE